MKLSISTLILLIVPARFLPTHVVIKLMKRIDKKIRKDQNEENDFMIANSNNCAQMGFESYEVDGIIVKKNLLEKPFSSFLSSFILDFE